MSSWLTGGGGRTAYKLDLEIIKSPSTSWTSQSSSTLSESSNSPIAISTRKPRTPRKRPNQTYNEAAAILSTAYPKIFSSKHLTKPCKFTKPHYPLSYESLDLVVPYKIVENSGFLLHPPLIEKPNCPIEQKSVTSCEKSCQSPDEIVSKVVSSLEVCDEFQEDFDAESILDEEIEEGIIDNIMGKLNVENAPTKESNLRYNYSKCHQNYVGGTCYGFPIGLGFENRRQQYDVGMPSGVRALRNIDDSNWWRYSHVNVFDITPKFNKSPVKKKKKKVEKPMELRGSEPSSTRDNSIPKRMNKEYLSQSIKEEAIDVPKPKSGFLLKLNVDDILNAWSDKESPFSDEMLGSEAAGNDVRARLSQIDLFSENGGIREASVLRYKEKRRTRLFSKKIRYQVRKINADRRPRMKGRFVKNPNSPEDERDIRLE